MEEDVDLQTKPAQVGLCKTSPSHFREVPTKQKYLAPESQRLKANKGPRNYWEIIVERLVANHV